MENNGTLKKRRKRNLVKVAGLSTIQYNVADDNFDGAAVFISSTTLDRGKKVIQKRVGGSGICETVVRMEELLKDAKSVRPNFRGTRDPTFHLDTEDCEENGIIEEYQHGLPSLNEEREVIKTRPYFFDKKTMARLRQILILGMCTGAFPWMWNVKKHKIEKWSPACLKGWKIFCFLISLQHVFLGIWQLHNTISSIPHERKKSYRAMFMNLASAFAMFSVVCVNINIFFYQDQIRKYVNTLFLLNRELMEKYVVNLQGYKGGGRILINWNIPTKIVEVFIAVSLFLMFPYSHRYLTSYINPRSWYCLIPGAWQQFIGIGQVSSSYILFQWIMFAHANSLEFWLRESHQNNDTGYTLDDLRHPKTAVETYRILQIICTSFNDCMAPLLIPIIKLHSFFGLIPFGFVTFRSLSTFLNELPGILLYPLAIIGYSIATFSTMSLSATAVDLASGFMDSWGRTKNKDFRRILMSCPTLKVKVARFYFITHNTTITFFHVVIGYVINCIITFP